MLAEQNHLKLVADLTENETALVQLSDADVDDVSGALGPIAIAALVVGGAVVVPFGLGVAAGYFANR